MGTNWGNIIQFMVSLNINSYLNGDSSLELSWYKCFGMLRNLECHATFSLNRKSQIFDWPVNITNWARLECDKWILRFLNCVWILYFFFVLAFDWIIVWISIGAARKPKWNQCIAQPKSRLLNRLLVGIKSGRRLTVTPRSWVAFMKFKFNT